MSTINAQDVHDTFIDCLFTEEELDEVTPGEAPEGAVIAEGIVMKVGFHPCRLESHRTEVVTWLEALDRNFFVEAEGGGGGWSFLQLPADANGDLWGQQQNAEQLMMLGVGLGLVTPLLPREMWSALPGGVPYLAVSTQEAA